MMKNRSLAILILNLLLFCAISAQSPNKIISRANKAYGGEKVLKTITSWQANGTVKRLSDGATGSFSTAAGGGNLFAESFDIDGFEVSSAFNGKSGWTRDSRSGLRTVTGIASKGFQAEASYRNSRWLNVKNEKSKLVYGGTSEVNGKPANLVTINTLKGIQIKLFFDSSSGLLLREEFPQGETPKIFDYDNYKPVSGIQTAFRITLKMDEEAYQIELADARYNQQISRKIFDIPSISTEPLPDIKGLLEEIRRNSEKLDEILENYSYTETRIERDLDKEGNLIEKGSEKRSLSFYRGYRINRTIEKSGSPLSPSDQAKEDRDAQKQVAEIEKRIQEKERKQIKERDTASGTAGQPNDDGNSQRITIADALKGSILTNPRRERFKGIDVIVFDYEPDPAFKPQSRMEKLFALCNGAVWVDSKTKQVVRLDAVLTRNLGNFIGKAKQGASFSIENELVNNEVWLPQVADVNLSIKVLFVGFNINNLIKYGDYNKFRTEVTDGKVDEIKKP